MSAPTAAAAITQGDAGRLKLSGAWSVHCLGTIEAQLGLIKPAADGPLQLDCAEITALDTAGAWLLQTLLIRLRGTPAGANLSGLQPEFTKRLQGSL